MGWAVSAASTATSAASEAAVAAVLAATLSSSPAAASSFSGPSATSTRPRPSVLERNPYSVSFAGPGRSHGGRWGRRRLNTDSIDPSVFERLEVQDLEI